VAVSPFVRNKSDMTIVLKLGLQYILHRKNEDISHLSTTKKKKKTYQRKSRYAIQGETFFKRAFDWVQVVQNLCTEVFWDIPNSYLFHLDNSNVIL
jgi:hypothetical protein